MLGQVPPHTMPSGRLCDRFGTPHIIEPGTLVNMVALSHREAQPQVVSPRVNRRAQVAFMPFYTHQLPLGLAPADGDHLDEPKTKP